MSKTFLFQAVQFSQKIVFSISMSLVLLSPVRCYHAGPVWTWEQWQGRGALHSRKPQHYWNLTIRLFSVISGHSLGGGFLPLCREAVVVFYSPNRLGKLQLVFVLFVFELFSFFLKNLSFVVFVFLFFFLVFFYC